MAPSLLPPEPDGSELKRWAEDGLKRGPGHSNVVTYHDPQDRWQMTIEVDDPVHGYLIRLFQIESGSRIGQTIVDDRELAIQIAAEMAAAAADLAALEERPRLGPKDIYREDVDEGHVDPPDGWDDEEDWQDALDEAFEEADIRRSKGTLTTKTIDGRDYYYLQWREGDKVKSQYVAPVSPAN